MRSVLVGPHELSFDCLERTLPRQRIGVFAIGHVDPAGTFRVQRVGRDEEDVQARLRSLIGSANKFKFALVHSAFEAFEIECELFHKLRPPSNVTHPNCPPGSGWKCRHCVQLHL